MRVELKFAEAVRPALARWFCTFGRTDDERREWFGTFLEAITARFQEYDGIPPEAFPRETAHGTAYWWQCSNDIYLHYQLRESPPSPRGWWDAPRWVARLFRQPVRTVIIFEIAEQRPPG